MLPIYGWRRNKDLLLLFIIVNHSRDSRNSRDAEYSRDVNDIKEIRNIGNASSRRDVGTAATAETLVKAGTPGTSTAIEQQQRQGRQKQQRPLQQLGYKQRGRYNIGHSRVYKNSTSNITKYARNSRDVSTSSRDDSNAAWYATSPIKWSF